MQQSSFLLGCNYSNCGITEAKTNWNQSPVLTNKYGVNVNGDNAVSLLYNDLYFRELKESLKNTMLLHQSIFETQIQELHRLYRKQKELMMEIDRTRQIEAGVLVDNKAEKSEKKVFNLELPGFDMNREVPEDQSLKKMSNETSKESNKLQFDLNEPAEIEEHSDYVLNQLLSSVTSNETEKESNTKKEVEISVKSSNEAKGIDLNMPPISSDEEEETIVEKFETEKPQESLSILVKPRVVIQALPCSTSSLLKPLKRGSRASKKEQLDSHLSVEAITESQVRNQTSLSKKTRCKPRMNGRIKRKKKSRKISLVTERNNEEISAAEAIVDMSRKSSGQETTSLARNLLWLAEIAEDSEKKTNQRRPLRSQAKQGKRLIDKPEFSGCEGNEVIRKLIEDSEVKCNHWEGIKKGRRGSRVPATDFQYMIINQEVYNSQS